MMPNLIIIAGPNGSGKTTSRIASRVMEGGHDVPINKIVSRYSKSIANCCVAINIVNRAYIYDNSQNYADPILFISNG